MYLMTEMDILEDGVELELPMKIGMMMILVSIYWGHPVVEDMEVMVAIVETGVLVEVGEDMVVTVEIPLVNMLVEVGEDMVVMEEKFL